MKKVRKLYKEKLNSIVQTNYVVIDIIDYNRLMYDNIRNTQRINEIYRLLNTTLTANNKNL